MRAKLSNNNINLVSFFPSSFNNEFSDLDSLNDEDLLNFVSGACYNISTEITNYLGRNIKVFVAQWNNTEIVKLIDLLDIGSYEGKSFFIENDIWESLFLVVVHQDKDWSQSFLKISETTDNSFWVIGRTISNDVISNEVENGDFSDGYEVEGDSYLNMDRNIDQIEKVEQLFKNLE